MRYLVSDIPQGFAKGIDQSFSETPEHLGFIGDEIHIDGNVEGQLTLWKDGTLITIQGAISAKVVLECSRCLTIIMVSLNPVVTLRCLPEASLRNEMHETGEVTPEDDIYTYSGLLIDIRPMIREQMVLAVPSYSYCRPECQGLCVVCGGDLNRTQCSCFAAHHDGGFPVLQ